MDKTLSSRTKMDEVKKMEAAPMKKGQLPFYSWLFRKVCC